MPFWANRVVWMRAGLVLGIVASLLATSCSGEDRCDDDVDAVAACRRQYSTDLCSTPEGRCVAACYGGATCDELDRFDEGDEVPRLDVCLGQCVERHSCRDGDQVHAAWVCDGEKDCLDGSDEDDCTYFECASGELIAEDAKCDEYAHCADRSDETECDFFLCVNGSAAIESSLRCNRAPDCSDGSDEDGCT